MISKSENPTRYNLLNQLEPSLVDVGENSELYFGERILKERALSEKFSVVDEVNLFSVYLVLNAAGGNRVLGGLH